MKKYLWGLTCLLGACIATIAVQAQTVPGIKGGVNIADVSGMNGDNRISGHVGLFLHHTINERWCIQPELLYSGQGQQYMTSDGERTLALSYIQVPVMVQYYPVRNLYFEAGPQVGFLTSAKVKGDDGDTKTEADNSYRKAEVGLNLGMGVGVTERLGFYARYNAGLTDISKNSSADNYNRSGLLGISWRLR